MCVLGRICVSRLLLGTFEFSNEGLDTPCTRYAIIHKSAGHEASDVRFKWSLCTGKPTVSCNNSEELNNMADIVNSALSPLFSAYVEAHGIKKQAEATLENLRPDITNALRRMPQGFTVDTPEASHVVKLGAQNRSYGITGEEAAKVKGIKPAVYRKLVTVDTKMVKTCLEAGLITEAQATALMTFKSVDMITVKVV